VIRFVLPAWLAAGLVAASTASAALIIDDQFADGNLGSNPGTGSGFTSVTLDGPAWTESGTDARHALGTNGSQRASLQSNDSFVANGANTTRVQWTISGWSRDNVDSGNGRFMIGVAPNGAPGEYPFAGGKVDGLWIGMNTEADAHPGVGVSGVTYVDSGTVTGLGSSWQWDDNGVDTPGATLIDITTDGSPTREDRVGIAMNAPDLTVILEIAQDSWSVDFSSTGGVVVLPAPQSGTFSSAGLTNDLSNAIVSVYHQGNGNHFASIDRIAVEILEPASPVQPGTFIDEDVEGNTNGWSGWRGTLTPPYLGLLPLAGDIDDPALTGATAVPDALNLLDNAVPYINGTEIATKTYNLAIEPGIYEFLIQMGNWNNNVFPNPTFDFSGLTPDTVLAPTPASGDDEIWRFTYTVNPGDPAVGELVALTFQGTLSTGNYAVDHVLGRFTAFVIPEPSTLLVWSVLAGLGIGVGWRRRRA